MQTILAGLLSLLLIVPKPAKTYTIPELIDRARLSLVKVSYEVEQEGQIGMRYCAGFVINAARGWAVTGGVNHCVPAGEDAVVYIDESYESHVIEANEQFAIVRIAPMSKPPVELRKGLPELGEQIVSVGYGMGQFSALVRRVGMVKDLDILIDGELIHGMSGGPALDEQGRVVGMNQATLPHEGAGVLCGSDEIRAFMKTVKG